MRWSNLETTSEELRRLPGYREPAAVRRFDAPEALDVRFYEVQAKSVLNRVPERSRMPFRWTVNPYRGCSHACSYCQSGETPILMGDGRTKRLADLKVGDAIYGTVGPAACRRYAITTVEAHWMTSKPAYRVVLQEGTELVASGDHRFLTSRGWEYVAGVEPGAGQRPHLTTDSGLMGSGRFASPPKESGDYRRGYLAGLIRGDGHLSFDPDRRPSGALETVHAFRLGPADFEALRRARQYLADVDIPTGEYLHEAAGGARGPLSSIHTRARDKVSLIRELIRRPRSPGLEWTKGFLAGIYDAEGCYSNGNVRIANTDPEILFRTGSYLQELGFDFVLEPPDQTNGLAFARVRGGLREHLRFFHAVDPAVTRKRAIEGRAIKALAPLQVASIEPLHDDLPLYDITTGTGDFIANGVVSHNCFARPTHTYLDFNAGRDFEREIVVKVNAPEVARAELMRPSWKREHVALGTNTDPYQWVESRYKLMPGIWEAM